MSGLEIENMTRGVQHADLDLKGSQLFLDLRGLREARRQAWGQVQTVVETTQLQVIHLELTCELAGFVKGDRRATQG